MKFRRGMTLIELLVVIAITLILAGGIFYAYRTIVQQAITQSLVAKNEQDVETLLYQIRKDIATTGFGVPSNMLRFWPNPACGNLAGFASSNSTIGRVSCGNSDEFYFVSLATREFTFSGCWWIVDNVGNINRQSRRWTFEECPSIPNTNSSLCLDLVTKSLLTACDPSRPNTIIFETDGYSLDRFAVRYYLRGTNLPKECAPNTFNLMKEISGDIPQPVASCIAVFRVRYYDGVQYSENPPADFRNLVAIRLCMLIQVGGRTGALIDPPNTFERCGSIATQPAWREYRWRLIEEDIPLYNLQ
ncbi:type II secretion system protein [Thermocrinis sp.]|uniref:PilW family protein n=1 Tax=Thermocrinis sp. TaxID=2024383 RepID=UPI002FDDD117